VGEWSSQLSGKTLVGGHFLPEESPDAVAAELETFLARGALDAAATGGTVLVCGAPPPGTEIAVDIQSILTGKILRGVTMGDSNPAELIPQLIELHAEGKLPLERFQKRYSIDEVQQAAEDMHRGVTVKPVIVF
jgi:aryl-alcohol dehydrogenase